MEKWNIGLYVEYAYGLSVVPRGATNVATPRGNALYYGRSGAHGKGTLVRSISNTTPAPHYTLEMFTIPRDEGTVGHNCYC